MCGLDGYAHQPKKDKDLNIAMKDRALKGSMKKLKKKKKITGFSNVCK